MNTLYCIQCKARTPRNFADEKRYDGIYCRDCAEALGYTPKPNPKYIPPPTSGSNVQKPIDREAVWNANLGSLSAGAFGDPSEPETLLRYWKAQETAGYPGASENVKYFQDILATLLRYWKAQEAAGYPGASENVKYFQDILNKKEDLTNAN